MNDSIFAGIGALDGGPTRPGRPRRQGGAGRQRRLALRADTQYEGLERLQKRFGEQGFTVLGVPCNQFAGPGAGQRGGDPRVLLGDLRDDLPADREARRQRRPPPSPLRLAGRDRRRRRARRGDRWNFEKFLVSLAARSARFRPTVDPEDRADRRRDRGGRSRRRGARKVMATRGARSATVSSGRRDPPLVSRIEERMLGERLHRLHRGHAARWTEAADDPRRRGRGPGLGPRWH